MSTLTFPTIASPAFQLGEANVVRNASRVFLAFAVMLTTIAFIVPFEESWTRSTYDQSLDEVRSESGARYGTISRQIAMASLGLFGLMALAASDGKTLRARGILGVFCLAYLVWCIASFMWTDDLWMSLRRVISLACEVTAGMAIAKRASARQFAWIVFVCTVTWLGMGIVAELSQEAFRPWQQGYRFYGIFHPNIIGANCALLIMSSLYLGSGGQLRNRLLYVIAGIAFVFLLLTGSRTALGAMLVSIAAWWMIMAPVSRMLVNSLVLGAAAVCLALAVAFGAFNISTDAIALGRQDHEVSSLTGRIPLWIELLEEYVNERPLAGHGYGAFWTDVHIAEVSHTQRWNVPYAHSTYIDLLLSVGYIGATLCLLAMILALFRASRLEAQQAKAGYGFIAMIILYTLADGLLETNIGSTSFMSFFTICGTCFLLFQNEQDSPHTLPKTEPPRLRSKPRLRHSK